MQANNGGKNQRALAAFTEFYRILCIYLTVPALLLSQHSFTLCNRPMGLIGMFQLDGEMG
jgi:hypothetical protein